jgi:hypothetical protein
VLALPIWARLCEPGDVDRHAFVTTASAHDTARRYVSENNRVVASAVSRGEALPRPDTARMRRIAVAAVADRRRRAAPASSCAMAKEALTRGTHPTNITAW